MSHPFPWVYCTLSKQDKEQIDAYLHIEIPDKLEELKALLARENLNPFNMLPLLLPTFLWKNGVTVLPEKAWSIDGMIMIALKLCSSKDLMAYFLATQITQPDSDNTSQKREPIGQIGRFTDWRHNTLSGEEINNLQGLLHGEYHDVIQQLSLDLKKEGVNPFEYPIRDIAVFIEMHQYNLPPQAFCMDGLALIGIHCA